MVDVTSIVYYAGYMTQVDSSLAALDFIHSHPEPESPCPAALSRELRRFRLTLTRLLTDEAQGRGPREEDLLALNRVLSRAAACRGLVSTVRGYGWGWTREPSPVLRLLFPPAWSAAQLLTGELRHRIKCCDGCGRLFVDRSPNRSRRWCEMEGCGNRAKVRRHRKRSVV